MGFDDRDNFLSIAFGVLIFLFTSICCIYEVCYLPPRYVRVNVIQNNPRTRYDEYLPQYERPPGYELHTMHEPSCPPPTYQPSRIQNQRYSLQQV